MKAESWLKMTLTSRRHWGDTIKGNEGRNLCFVLRQLRSQVQVYSYRDAQRDIREFRFRRNRAGVGSYFVAGT